MWALRTAMMLALIVWIGGIIFFAFVVTRTLFVVLPTTQMAGNVVSPVLSKLHYMGLIAGAVFLICSLLHNRWKYLQLRLFSATHILLVLMLLMTAVSQFGITPRMRELRSGPPSIDPIGDRAEFERLHEWSTHLEGGVLFLGLGVVILTARRFETIGH